MTGRVDHVGVVVTDTPAAVGDANLVDPIIAAVEAECTIGEICGVLRKVFGEYRPAAAL